MKHSNLFVFVVAALVIIMLAVPPTSAQEDCPPTSTSTPVPSPTKPAAVELLAFEAHGNEIIWQTGIEINTVGFNLHRAFGDGSFEQINEVLIPGKSLGQIESSTYTYIDANVCAHVLCLYQLEEVEVGGVKQWYGPVENGVEASQARVTIRDPRAHSPADIAALVVAILLFLCASLATVLAFRK